MKIVVAYKWAASPQYATVADDGTLDWGRAKPGLSEYDPVAVEVGRRLAAATGGELVGLTAGDEAVAASLATKAALSRGLDRTVLVVDPVLAGAGPAPTGAALAAAVRTLGDVDVVLTGESSVDEGAGLVPAVLAQTLGLPLLTGVQEIVPDSDRLLVRRAWAGGTQQVRVAGPVVLATRSDALVPPAPGMKDILAASKRPVELLTLADVGDPELPAALRVLSTAPPPVQSRARRSVGTTDPDAAAAELVAALRGADVL